ncbi:MAG: type II toxin-antitoxin system VapB family antitoxin [Candidatus Latescibacterota bacterium]|jgi:Arc/MetJ family transcription regulator
MKTTIDIPDSILRDAMRLSGAATKRQAVVTAMTEYIQRGKMAALAKHLGSCADLMTPEELERLRNES